MLLPPTMPTSGSTRRLKRRSGGGAVCRAVLSRRKASSPMAPLKSQRSTCGSMRVATRAISQVVSVADRPMAAMARHGMGWRCW